MFSKNLALTASFLSHIAHKVMKKLEVFHKWMTIGLKHTQKTTAHHLVLKLVTEYSLKASNLANGTYNTGELNIGLSV